MAKSKKSKILAMALCASVMTGIYASPVMANKVEEDVNTLNKITQNINASKTIDGKTVFVGKVIADKFATWNNAFYVDKNGTIKGNSLIIGKNGDNAVFKVDRNGAVKAANGAFYVDKGGNVTTKGDVTTLNDDGTVNYSLNTIGANTAGIVRLGETTTIENTVSVDKWGLKVLDENGKTVASINSTNGGINAANGKFHVYSEGQIEGTALSLMNNGAQNVYIDNSGTARFGDKDGANVRVENGGIYLKDNGEISASLTDKTLKLGDNVLNETQLGNINNMITGAGVLENVISINGAAVEGVGDGGLKISEVTLEKGGIWAEKLNGRLISEYVTDDEISGDLENIGGIDRKDVTGEGKPGEGTTTIENLLNVSGDSVSASLGNNSFTFDNSGFKFTGVVNLGSASDIYFNYGGVGNGTDYAGSYTLEDLADTVADIYDRTQAIDYENGTTTIKGDLDVVKDPNAGSGEGGDPGTGEGGNTGNGNGHYDGNLDVDGGITAGDSTIGDVGLEGGTVTADKVVTGNTTLDNEGLNVGGQTSVTADGVNVGGNGGTTVSKDGVSIADKTIISDHDVVINEGTADRVSLSETADRVGNLEQGVSELNNRVGELEDRIDKVGAMAAAIANLRTMGYDPAAPTEVAVGIGQYRDETGAALGLFHYPNRDFMLSLSVSTSGDEVMGGIGATWKFGRKSPEKVAEIKKAQAEADARRAEEAKLAKAEEMKQAAKEVKIKAQQERHAKLAAERAAQAEAAK